MITLKFILQRQQSVTVLKPALNFKLIQFMKPLATCMNCLLQKLQCTL